MVIVISALRALVLVVATLALMPQPTLAQSTRDKISKSANPVGIRKKIAAPTREYVHEWVKMPHITGFDLSTNTKTTIKPKKGRALVAYFIASYDIGSQNLISQLIELQNKYDDHFTDFVYVFLNDLKSEARSFVKDKKIVGTVVMGDAQTKKRFRFPPLNLPLIYVGDRKGWLTSFYNKAEYKNILDLDKFLALITDV